MSSMLVSDNMQWRIASTIEGSQTEYFMIVVSGTFEVEVSECNG